jgi:putative ABC transport system permease protein
MFSGLFLGIQILVWIVGCGTLLAGIVGVSNIMIVILKERTHEIGIQRAIGAHPWIIIRQIMMESLTLTFIAGYIGLVLGVLIIEGVAFALKQSGGSSPFFANPEVNFKVAVTAIFILVISGLLAGFFPARRAMKIKPVDAMREE